MTKDGKSFVRLIQHKGKFDLQRGVIAGAADGADEEDEEADVLGGGGGGEDEAEAQSPARLRSPSKPAGTGDYLVAAGASPSPSPSRGELRKRREEAAQNHNTLHARIDAPLRSLRLAAAHEALLTGLLERDAAKRLGARGSAEVQTHAFLVDVEWELLRQRLLPSPFKPDPRHVYAKDRVPALSRSAGAHRKSRHERECFRLLLHPPPSDRRGAAAVHRAHRRGCVAVRRRRAGAREHPRPPPTLRQLADSEGEIAPARGRRTPTSWRSTCASDRARAPSCKRRSGRRGRPLH